MDIVNLTPHRITIEYENGERVSVEPTLPSARIQQKNVIVGQIDGISVSKVEYGEVENLPDAEVGKIYIVSAIVSQQCPLRGDVFAPDTGPTAIRNESGHIVAVRGLVSSAWMDQF